MDTGIDPTREGGMARGEEGKGKGGGDGLKGLRGEEGRGKDAQRGRRGK